MSVYPVKYKVLNKDTGRKVSVTRWRAQIRKNGENLSKLFEEEEAARSWEKSELDRLAMGVPPALITDLKYQLEMPDMQGLLKTYYTKHAVNHLSESSLKTTKNRCLSAIPKVPIYFADLGKRLEKYRYDNVWLQHMIKGTLDKNYIDFGSFKIDTVDSWLLIHYMNSRRKTGIKDNTILREISTISSAFEAVYKLYPDQFPDGLANPVRLLPRAEKPKAYLGRKRVLSDEEAVLIAEWLSMKTNQEPYFLFITCLESGARKSEVLGARWENLNLTSWSLYLPKTKNGKPRDIMLPEDEEFRSWLKEKRLAKGMIFKLTADNFRQYWVDALKALGMYDDAEDRLHFHDTRRTALTKLIKQKRLNNWQLAKEIGASPATIEAEVAKMPNRLEPIFAKLRNGQSLNEEEIMLLAGHSSSAITNVYFGDRN